VDRLSAGGALWKVVGNQTFFGPLSAVIGGAAPIDVDAWDGYATERRWLTAELARRGVKNLVLLTGDLHSTIAADVKQDYNNLNPFDFGNYVGVEFMSPSVTSAALLDALSQNMPPSAFHDGLTEAAVRINNPHIQYFNSSRHGYATVQFTRTAATWTAYAVDKATAADSATRQPLARFRKSVGWPFLIKESTAGL
jgi:alkaline phosphatase D